MGPAKFGMKVSQLIVVPEDSAGYSHVCGWHYVHVHVRTMCMYIHVHKNFICEICAIPLHTHTCTCTCTHVGSKDAWYKKNNEDRTKVLQKWVINSGAR